MLLFLAVLLRSYSYLLQAIQADGTPGEDNCQAGVDEN